MPRDRLEGHGARCVGGGGDLPGELELPSSQRAGC